MGRQLRIISSIYLGLVAVITFGQTTDTIKVLDKLSGDIFIICKNERERIGRQQTKDDSLNNCTLTKTYQTDHKDIYYLKVYNLYGQLREEGFAKAVWRDRKILGIKLKPKNFSLVNDGQWKFYDNNGYKTSDCCYYNDKICSGCVWTTYDDKGNKTQEIIIDH